MKALTLTQPWATLVAIGAKRIETRSWGTAYRGPLAIHAAKKWTLEGMSLFFSEPFQSTLEAAGYKLSGRLPLGEIVAVCELVSVREIAPIHAQRKAIGWEWRGPDGRLYRFLIDDREFMLGDYRAGRKAWMLDKVRTLDIHVPARGSLGLWNCPDDIERC